MSRWAGHWWPVTMARAPASAEANEGMLPESPEEPSGRRHLTAPRRSIQKSVPSLVKSSCMGSSQPETTVDLTKRSGSSAGAGRMDARASVRDGRMREFTAGGWWGVRGDGRGWGGRQRRWARTLRGGEDGVSGGDD